MRACCHFPQLFGEGDVSMNPNAPPAVVAPGPINLPPFLFQPLGEGVLKITATTDVDKGKITIGVWVKPGPAFDPNKVPSELGGTFFPATGIPVSLFVIKIQDVTVGDVGTVLTTTGPQVAPHTIAFMGKVVDFLTQTKPFGDTAGRAAAISAEYDATGDIVNFTFVGGFVAGSHSTWNFTASGSLYLPE
jgi:hypothetical protein